MALIGYDQAKEFAKKQGYWTGDYAGWDAGAGSGSDIYESWRSQQGPMTGIGEQQAQTQFRDLYNEWLQNKNAGWSANEWAGTSSEQTGIPDAPNVGDYTDPYQGKSETRWVNGHPETWAIDTKTGEWYLVKSYEGQWNSLQGLSSMIGEGSGLESVAAWLEANGKDMANVDDITSALDTMIAELQSGGANDLEEARDYAAGQFGMGSEDYYDMKGLLTQQLAGGVEGMQGFSDEQRANRENFYDFQRQQEMKGMQEMYDNAIASGQGRGLALRNSDAAMSRIRSSQYQQKLAMDDEESRLKDSEWQRKNQMMGQMVQLGVMSEGQYMDNLNKNRSLAIQSLATKSSILMQQNQQYLQMYQADFQATEAYIQSEYNRINAEMGLDQAAMDMAEQVYNQNMAEYQWDLDQYEIDLDAYETNKTDMAQIAADQAAEDASNLQLGGGILAAIAGVVGIIAGIVTLNPLLIGAGVMGVGAGVDIAF